MFFDVPSPYLQLSLCIIAPDSARLPLVWLVHLLEPVIIVQVLLVVAKARHVHRRIGKDVTLPSHRLLDLLDSISIYGQLVKCRR